jgi:hypothetical protein
MLPDRRVHGVGGKVQLAGPGHGTVIECDLREQRRVTERGEDPSLWRMHQGGHVNHSGKAIGECNPQTEPRKGFDFGHAPWRTGGRIPEWLG